MAEHMPSAHRAHAEWTPSRLIGWAEKVGPATAQLVTRILESRPHPEQGYRTVLGITGWRPLSDGTVDVGGMRACRTAHAPACRRTRMRLPGA